MTKQRTKVMVDILEEHFEELEFLWTQRRDALHSADFTPRDLAELDQRIEAHVAGLLVGGEATVAVARELLTADDPMMVFAAAYTLLRFHTEEAAQPLLAALSPAEPPQREGLREALCHGPIGMVEGPLRRALDDGPPAVAAVAAEALAFHRRLDRAPARLKALREDPDPAVRRAAWRVAAMADANKY